MAFQVRSFTLGAGAGLVSAALIAVTAFAQPGADHAAMTMPAAAPPALDVSTAHSFAELMSNADARMHCGMAGAARTGHPDNDFASEMIPHHAGAVTMAKVELLYGRDPVLRRMAQEIIVSQQQEIDVMQRRLATLPAR